MGEFVFFFPSKILESILRSSSLWPVTIIFWLRLTPLFCKIFTCGVPLQGGFSDQFQAFPGKMYWKAAKICFEMGVVGSYGQPGAKHFRKWTKPRQMAFLRYFLPQVPVSRLTRVKAATLPMDQLSVSQKDRPGLDLGETPWRSWIQTLPLTWGYQDWRLYTVW